MLEIGRVGDHPLHILAAQDHRKLPRLTQGRKRAFCEEESSQTGGRSEHRATITM